ncbi:MAG TPA: AbrB/MazE/SpoVT family DNA-binding domain-containing protein [Candidatus Bathyarchaeia archaeon]
MESEKGNLEAKEDEKEKKSEGKPKERVIVKGYMRPDGTSYYVVIPKAIREMFELKGGEYFLIRAKPGKSKIELKIAKFVEE